MNFYSVTKVIADLPELSAALNYDGLITYIDLVRLLKPDLTHFVVSLPNIFPWLFMTS